MNPALSCQHSVQFTWYARACSCFCTSASYGNHFSRSNRARPCSRQLYFFFAIADLFIASAPSHFLSVLARVGSRCSPLHPTARRCLAAVRYARRFCGARRWLGLRPEVRCGRYGWYWCLSADAAYLVVLRSHVRTHFSYVFCYRVVVSGAWRAEARTRGSVLGASS